MNGSVLTQKVMQQIEGHTSCTTFRLPPHGAGL
jgi:hypothetical protein